MFTTCELFPKEKPSRRRHQKKWHAHAPMRVSPLLLCAGKSSQHLSLVRLSNGPLIPTMAWFFALTCSLVCKQEVQNSGQHNRTKQLLCTVHGRNWKPPLCSETFCWRSSHSEPTAPFFWNAPISEESEAHWEFLCTVNHAFKCALHAKSTTLKFGKTIWTKHTHWKPTLQFPTELQQWKKWKGNSSKTTGFLQLVSFVDFCCWNAAKAWQLHDHWHDWSTLATALSLINQQQSPPEEQLAREAQNKTQHTLELGGELGHKMNGTPLGNQAGKQIQELGQHFCTLKGCGPKKPPSTCPHQPLRKFAPQKNSVLACAI